MEWSPETLIFGGATKGPEVFAGPADIFAGAGAPSILTASPEATIPAIAKIGRNPREEKKMYASSGLGDVM